MAMTALVSISGDVRSTGVLTAYHGSQIQGIQNEISKVASLWAVPGRRHVPARCLC